jgi:hypothetical protein
MKELIKELVSNLINPQAKEKKKADLKYDLHVKFDKSLYLKDYLKTRAWVDFQRPIIYSSLESGLSRLLTDGLAMNETDIKSLIASMRANLNVIIEMRYAIEDGEKAGAKLEKLT